MTPTVLVLTPSIGGYYFGELLAGVTREVAGAGGRIVLVQTLEAGTRYGERGEPGDVSDFTSPVAWSEVDAVVSVTTAADASYLRQFRAGGKPVVLVGTVTEGFEAPLALPDNHRGTVAAVEHLLGHGHTRIGFVGNLVQDDVRDRHAAYVQTLEAHGLVVDPALTFAAPNNARSGGVRAARDVLTFPHPLTALMIATDRNAIGLMRTLRSAGVSVPRDIAVMAFDNTEASAFSTPSLSTVNQRFDETGALAGRLVLAAMRGETAPSVSYASPSVVLAIRDSCGCSPDGLDGATGLAAPTASAAPALSRVELEDELCRVLLTGRSVVDNPLRAAVLATVSELDRLLRKGDDVSTAEIRALTDSFLDLTAGPDTLRRITGAATEYVQGAAAHDAAGHGATSIAGVARMTSALWQLQAGAFLRQAEATETALDEQFAVDAALLTTDRFDPRHLGWLDGTHVRAGALALWEDGPASGLLRVVGTYDPAGILPALIDSVTTPENFPPAALIAAAEPSERDVCVVVPVRTPERDWGLLAVVGEIATTAARETYHHRAALLSASLESERLQETVRNYALYDVLTGLPNRRLFLDRLTHAVALWHRSATPFAVIFLDLDGFKLINDSLGHQMGDRVLAAVGDRIERALRSVDTGARFGGDEFAILLHDVDAVDVLLIVERIRAVLSEVVDLDGREFAISASLGVATSAIDYATGEDVLRDADTAMYQAKATERGTVAFFDEAMHVRAVQYLSLHAEVRRALDQNQFEMYYQPIVDLGSGRSDRCEALVRWNHPERGLVLPHEFLPVMGETGLMVQLGHWIIDDVCRQLAAWGPAVANVAVNVSDREFWHGDLLTTVQRALTRHGLGPDRLTLEITEGVIMRRPEAALDLMADLHEAGLQLHIDDFGTGHSSLEMLHRFPVDAFKIDRSFVHRLTSGDRAEELVRAIVAMGKALRLAVVAEGVETDEQLAFLQSIGCATGQGFLFAPAVTGDRVAALIGRVLSADASVIAAVPAPFSPPAQVPLDART